LTFNSFSKPNNLLAQTLFYCRSFYLSLPLSHFLSLTYHFFCDSLSLPYFLFCIKLIWFTVGIERRHAACECCTALFISFLYLLQKCFSVCLSFYVSRWWYCKLQNVVSPVALSHLLLLLIEYLDVNLIVHCDQIKIEEISYYFYTNNRFECDLIFW